MNGREIAQVMIALQDQGCHNINFVTPEHVVPQVVEAIACAVDMGLSIPIVYNTSAYDSLESLELLNGLIDIYMPDLKCWEPPTAARLLGARDYPERAKESVREMFHQVGNLKFNKSGIAMRGLLVRHLVLPGLEEESKQIMEWIAGEISKDVFVNIMDQYRPAHKVGNRKKDKSLAFTGINRKIQQDEITKVYGFAQAAGLWRFDTEL
jgi:putative pyruvate formate lyase activating enzyme